jgi:hypothetical protein
VKKKKEEIYYEIKIIKKFTHSEEAATAVNKS